MEKTTTLDFEISRKDILNSNSMPNHHIVKGKMVSKLREMGAEAFTALHPEGAREVVIEKRKQLQATLDRKTERVRLAKRLKKLELSDRELEAELDERLPYPEHEELTIAPLWQHFTVRTDVFAPSRRHMDAPNFWPTVKAITDGGTDAVAWPDDDFKHMLEVSFRYAGLSGLKDTWRVRLTITEITDISGYQTVAELVED
jgi:hypothetical protein